MIDLLWVLGYVACCFTSYGIWNADMYHECEMDDDERKRQACWISILGPVSMILGISITKCKHGGRWEF